MTTSTELIHNSWIQFGEIPDVMPLNASEFGPFHPIGILFEVCISNTPSKWLNEKYTICQQPNSIEFQQNDI